MSRLAGFDKLCNSILTCAANSLERSAPNYVEDFRKALQQTNDLECAQSALANMKTDPQFSKWREICINLVDVGLQMHRVSDSLVLLNCQSIPPLPKGEWVDYHYNAWAILMQGLLCRVEKLTKSVIRRLIRPTNPEWKLIETDMLQKIEHFKLQMKPVRDPVAHAGGPVEAIATGHRIEVCVLVGGWDIKALFEACANYQHRWHKFLTASSTLILAEIDRLCEKLNSQVNWASVN